MSSIKVKPVDGRAIPHPQTGNTINRAQAVPNTREIRRALSVGDLERVEAPKPSPKPPKKEEAVTNG